MTKGRVRFAGSMAATGAGSGASEVDFEEEVMETRIEEVSYSFACSGANNTFTALLHDNLLF